jgi:MtaA/CmuA family methyltransferase
VEYRADGPPRSTHPLADSKDLAILRQPDPLSSERMFDRVKAVRAFKEQVGGEFSILGWVEGPAAEAADLRGVIDFMMDLMDDEPFAGELMDRCLEVAIAFADAQIAAGADTIGIGDAITSQVSPDTYERLIQPRQKKLAQAIRAKGAFVKLHICGNITHLLPGISDVGVDIIDVDHMVDIVAVREALGPGIAIAGNLDPVSVIKNGTPERIRQELERVYAESGNPYFAMGGCEIPAATPPENLKALCHPLAYRR